MGVWVFRYVCVVVCVCVFASVCVVCSIVFVCLSCVIALSECMGCVCVCVFVFVNSIVYILFNMCLFLIMFIGCPAAWYVVSNVVFMWMRVFCSLCVFCEYAVCFLFVCV